MSEFDPKGVSAIFKNVSNLKKSEISDGGGVQNWPKVDDVIWGRSLRDNVELKSVMEYNGV